MQTSGSCSLVVIMKQSCGKHQYLNISWMSEPLLMCLHSHYCVVFSHLFNCYGQLLIHRRVQQVVVFGEFNKPCTAFHFNPISQHRTLSIGHKKIHLWGKSRGQHPPVIKGHCMPQWKTIQAGVIPSEDLTLFTKYGQVHI